MRIVNSLVVATGGLLLLTFTTVAMEAAQPKVAVVEKEAEEKPEKVFVGYVYQVPKKINFGLYTHLCHAFVVADGDGNIRPNKSCPSHQLVTDAHKARVKILISLGGWGWDKQFAAIVSKTESEDRYVASVMKIVDQFDYDGIDLDWEYPDTKEEVVGFDRLARRFRKELDDLGGKRGQHLLQTMAASGSPSTLKWLENKLLLETMDWVNVMTYDFAGDWTSYAGHHSPLFASSKQPGTPRSTELSMKYLVDRGMPANRLAVGLPLYGKGFAVSEPYAATKKGVKAQVPKGGNYTNIEKLIKEKGWTRRWDDETKNPWAIASDGSAVIGYDDAESLSFRTEWAMKHGYRGVFFWQISGDLQPDGTNPLQHASRKAWEKSYPGTSSQTQVPATASWVKSADNPVLGGALGTCFDVALLKEGDKFRMWFSWRPKRNIALVESADGIHWSQPVLVLGPNKETSWEADINRPVVLKRGVTYHMWYTGQAKGHSWIGYASSGDGKTWTRISAKPVLSPEEPWEKVAVMCPHVIWDDKDSVFRMWYSGGEQYEPNAIGYATSADGKTWKRHGKDPIFSADPNNKWESQRVTGCQVLLHEGWHYMFYIGFRDVDHAQIGLARSREGVTQWQRHPANPIIRPSPDGWDRDAVYKPFAILDGQRWLLWYNGRKGGAEQIGLAIHDGADLGFNNTTGR